MVVDYIHLCYHQVLSYNEYFQKDFLDQNYKHMLIVKMKKLILIVFLGIWTAFTVWISLAVAVWYLPDNLTQSRAVTSCFEEHGMRNENQAVWRHFIHRNGRGIEVSLLNESGRANVMSIYRVCTFDSDMKLLWKYPAK